MSGCLKKLHKTPPKSREKPMTIRESSDGANYVPRVCRVWDAYVATTDQGRRIAILEGGRK